MACLLGWISSDRRPESAGSRQGDGSGLVARGRGYSGAKTSFAIVYTPKVGVQDLNKLINPLQRWVIEWADLVEFEIIPVATSKDMLAALASHL